MIVIAMLAIGGIIALAVGTSVAAAQRESGAYGGRPVTPPDRNQIAASLLFNLLLAGGTPPGKALKVIRGLGLIAPATAAIDIRSWGERFAQLAPPDHRAALLETAVRLVAERDTPVPLRQYTALLDLSFALGFQTNALAQLREKYPFEYIDHAKDARPREADRAGGATVLFERGARRDTGELLRVLEIDGPASRAVIIAAYRKLAAQHHPDRVFAQPAEVQSAAAARFIEITRAYEALLALYPE